MHTKPTGIAAFDSLRQTVAPTSESLSPTNWTADEPHCSDLVNAAARDSRVDDLKASCARIADLRAAQVTPQPAAPTTSDATGFGRTGPTGTKAVNSVDAGGTKGGGISLVVDEAAQERMDFTLGLDVPITLSTVDTVEMRPIFALDFKVDVPGAFSDTWVMNLRTGASSRYENFYFDSVMNVGGVLYGANSEGLFELGGDDDDGAPIEAVLDFGLKSFGSNQLKRLEQIYLTVASTGPMFVRVTAEGASYTYTMRDFNEAMQTQRVTPGKGMRANYFGFEVGNIDGADFELSAVEVLVAESSRRI